MKARSVLLIVLLAASLAACGRKGPLQPPPGAPDQPAQAGQEAPDDAVKPDRSFILDSIL